MNVNTSPIGDTPTTIVWNKLPEVPTKWYQITKTRFVVSAIFLTLGALALTPIVPTAILVVSPAVVILAAASFCLIATALLVSSIILCRMKKSHLDPEYRREQRDLVKNIVETKPEEATYTYLKKQEISHILLKHEVGIILLEDMQKMSYKDFIKKHTTQVLKYLDQKSIEVLKNKYIEQIVSGRENIGTAATSSEALFFGINKEDLMPNFLAYEISRLNLTKENYKNFKEHNGLELIAFSKDKDRELLVEKFQEYVVADTDNHSDEMLEKTYAEDFKVFGEEVKTAIVDKIIALRPKTIPLESSLGTFKSEPIRFTSEEDKVKLSQARNFVTALHNKSIGQNVGFERFNEAFDKFACSPNWELFIENAVERLLDIPLLKLASGSNSELRGFDRRIARVVLLKAIELIKLRQLASASEIANFEKKLAHFDTKVIEIPQAEVVKIGGGAVNSVYKVGNYGVFKPEETELSALAGLQAEMFSTAIASGIPSGVAGHSGARSVATSVVDEMLYGEEHRISVKTEYTVVNGRRGILMELAQGEHPKTEGRESRKIDLSTNPEAAKFIDQKFRSKSTISAKDLNSIGLMFNCRNVSCRRGLEGDWEFKGEFVKFKNFDPENATIAEELLKTQLLDLITGQVDRHQKNYFIQPSGKLMLIDNDCAFGIYAFPENRDVRLQPSIKFIVPNNGSLMLRPPVVITQELKKRVDDLHANRDLLKENLSYYIIASEVDATLRRLEILHGHLNSDKTLVVDDKEGLLSNSAKERMDSNNSYWARELQVFDSAETDLNYLRKARA